MRLRLGTLGRHRSACPLRRSGCPIPYIEEYEDGSAKLIRGDEYEWVKRPDDGGGNVAKISLFPCENLREMIHQFNWFGEISADVARQLLYQLDRDDFGASPHSPSRQKVEDAIPPSPSSDRSVKGNSPGRSYSATIKDSVMNGLDLEYSAIGDKSEPKTSQPNDELVYIQSDDGKVTKATSVNPIEWRGYQQVIWGALTENEWVNSVRGKHGLPPIRVDSDRPSSSDLSLAQIFEQNARSAKKSFSYPSSDEKLDELGAKVDAMAKAMTDLSEAISRNAESTVKLAKAVHDAVLAPRI